MASVRFHLIPFRIHVRLSACLSVPYRIIPPGLYWYGTSCVRSAGWSPAHPVASDHLSMWCSTGTKYRVRQHRYSGLSTKVHRRRFGGTSNVLPKSSSCHGPERTEYMYTHFGPNTTLPWVLVLDMYCTGTDAVQYFTVPSTLRRNGTRPPGKTRPGLYAGCTVRNKSIPYST